eukprot:gnl/TRDRNA2_/TRDRNA2_160859_c3_seq1.p1 gnl/TRDRNA2_/TRDRNA2_160859_c3~~gnl/TRDRNA2_/TRDRNA2_160859_c3_seq1.p1  ORF type:complete len:511 (-),score=78.76 gnl/TRDRNA2_/TRDRNA2_160859_c3_seq1:50-1426(-)
MAYGQTGSGKTHTMFGSLEPGSPNRGLAFRAIDKLATLLQNCDRAGGPPPYVELSFLEVYNDGLFDLLDGSRPLSKQRSSEKHVVPQGLTRKRCEIGDMEEQVRSWLREGASMRTVGKTVFNPRSSRSHAVVMLHICWGNDARSGRYRPETRLYLVDLAGSERSGLYSLSPEQLKEGEHINLSLSALGRVVSSLASGKSEHVPYRDSALTWLLKDAITGKSGRVCMVAAVHPAYAAETASTLRYARQYSTLQASASGRIPELASEVRDLQRKVDSLKHAFEKALASDEHQIPWTRESLRGNMHCQSRYNIKDLFEMHPFLEWTQGHQSKAAQRGQRRGTVGIGIARTFADIPPPRHPEEKPDGRRATNGKALPVPEAIGGDPPDRVVEVVFEGKHGRPPVVLWYPEAALEMVQPPKALLDAMVKLDQNEEELSRKRDELMKARKGEAADQQEWMSTAG